MQNLMLVLKGDDPFWIISDVDAYGFSANIKGFMA